MASPKVFPEKKYNSIFLRVASEDLDNLFIFKICQEGDIQFKKKNKYILNFFLK